MMKMEKVIKTNIKQDEITPYSSNTKNNTQGATSNNDSEELYYNKFNENVGIKVVGRGSWSGKNIMTKLCDFFPKKYYYFIGEYAIWIKRYLII